MKLSKKVTEEKKEKYYYLSTKGDNNISIIYESDRFKFEEFEILSLIRILMIERRNIMIGKKILDVYMDSNPEGSKEKLKKIGIIKNGNDKPTKTKHSKKK
jgi:hypothetical protein